MLEYERVRCGVRMREREREMLEECLYISCHTMVRDGRILPLVRCIRESTVVQVCAYERVREWEVVHMVNLVVQVWWLRWWRNLNPIEYDPVPKVRVLHQKWHEFCKIFQEHNWPRSGLVSTLVIESFALNRFRIYLFYLLEHIWFFVNSTLPRSGPFCRIYNYYFVIIILNYYYQNLFGWGAGIT